MNKQKKSEISKSSWWIGGIIGTMIAFAALGVKEEPGLVFFVGISNGLFWGWIIGLILDNIANSKSVANVKEVISETKERIQVQKESKMMMEQYNTSKRSFQYLSDDTLLQKYDDFRVTGDEDMTRLALEEELVNRALISHSPMHEKLALINEKLGS